MIGPGAKVRLLPSCFLNEFGSTGSLSLVDKETLEREGLGEGKVVEVVDSCFGTLYVMGEGSTEDWMVTEDEVERVEDGNV